MATYTLYSVENSGGRVYTSNTSWSAIRETSTVQAEGVNLMTVSGQFSGTNTYTVYQGFCKFDTSVIPDADLILSVALNLYLLNGSTPDSGTRCEARLYGGADWGTTLTSTTFLKGSALATSPVLAQIAAADAPSVNQYYTLTSTSAFGDNINKTGLTKIALIDSYFADNIPPVNSTNQWVWSVDSTFPDPANLAYITIVTYQGKVTLDSVIKGTRSGSFSTDATISKTLSGSFSVDAYFRQGGFVANAHIIRVRTKNLSASSFLTISSGNSFTATPNPTDGTVLVRVLHAPGSGITNSKLYRTITTGSALVASRPANFDITDVGAPFNATFGYEVRNYDSSGTLLSTETYTGYSMTGDDWWLASSSLGTLKIAVINHAGEIEVQSEVFLPINADFKTQQVGKVLGSKGSVEITAASADRASLEALISSYVSSDEQVYLKTPFGESLGVALTNYSVRLLGLGHGIITLNYCENI